MLKLMLRKLGLLRESPAIGAGKVWVRQKWVMCDPVSFDPFNYIYTEGFIFSPIYIVYVKGPLCCSDGGNISYHCKDLEEVYDTIKRCKGCSL